MGKETQVRNDEKKKPKGRFERIKRMHSKGGRPFWRKELIKKMNRNLRGGNPQTTKGLEKRYLEMGEEGKLGVPKRETGTKATRLYIKKKSNGGRTKGERMAWGGEK